MLRLYITFLASVFFVGCATQVTAPIPEYKLSSGKRVGILVDINDMPTHRHIGTTVFNNFLKTYPIEWDMDSLINEKLTNKLKEKEFEVVDLENEGMRSDELNGLLTTESQEWKAGNDKSKILSKLKNLDISSVVLIKEDETLAYLECTGGPCNSFTTDSHGMFSRSFLGIKNYFAVAAFSTDIFILEPYVNSATCKSFKNFAQGSSMFITKENKPKNLKNITKAEWIPFKNAITDYMYFSFVETANILQNGCMDS